MPQRVIERSVQHKTLFACYLRSSSLSTPIFECDITVRRIQGLVEGAEQSPMEVAALTAAGAFVHLLVAPTVSYLIVWRIGPTVATPD